MQNAVGNVVAVSSVFLGSFRYGLFGTFHVKLYDFAIIHIITLLSFVSRPFTLIHRGYTLFTTLLLEFFEKYF